MIFIEKYFLNLINQTEIRLYLPFSDWFGTKRMAVWFGTENGRSFSAPNQSGNGKYNLISGWFNLISKIFPCVQDCSYSFGRVAPKDFSCGRSDWKRWHLLSERLASLSIMGVNLGPPSTPQYDSALWWYKEFLWVINWAFTMPRYISLLCCFIVSGRQCNTVFVFALLLLPEIVAGNLLFSSIVAGKLFLGRKNIRKL